MSELPATIQEAATWLRSGRMTSVALTEGLLERSHAAQDSLAAFITITDETARAAAQQADADFTGGIDRGPLQGIPVAVKDIIVTSDAPTTANSHVLNPTWGQRGDATVIKNLRSAGAVLIGKLGLHEFACGWPDPDTGFRIPKNPWDVSRTPGGSSSGTGTAVAAGLVLGGLGTDTGGSIRGPSAYCGISGLKPTFGRVSKEGCVPLGYSLDNIGPMARTARDCALMLQVMAGYDPLDPCSVDVAVPQMDSGLDLESALQGVRIGVPREYFFTVAQLNDEVKAGVLAALNAMAAAGATVVDVEIPHAALGRIAGWLTSRAEAYAYHEPDLRERANLYGKYTRRTLQLGAFFSAADYVQAQRVRSLLKAECATALSGVDLLVTPTMLDVAPTFADFNPDSMIANPSFTSIWNLTGLPALSIPCGFSTSGLPIGMQLIGKAFDEPVLFKVGNAYQQITDWHTRVPHAAEALLLA